MMKFNIKNVFVLLFCAMVVFSCKKDEGDISTVTEPQKYTFATLPEALVVPEEAGTYEFTFTFDDKQIYDAHVLISPTSDATATEDVDYSLSTHAVDVATLVGTGSFSVTVDEDFEPEADETVIVNLAGDAPFNLPEAQVAQLLTIQNKIYPPAIALDWSTSFDFNGSVFNTCGNTDFDLFVNDDMGNEVSGFAGATGACPEIVFVDAISGDGTYDLVANLYGDGGISGLVTGGAIDSFAINMNVILFKGGVVSPSGSTTAYNTLDFAIDKFYSYTPSDPAGDMLITLGSVQVIGGEMILFDPNGAEVGRFD
jgi:hypothetical protein